jgi:hypothetical protein
MRRLFTLVDSLPENTGALEGNHFAGRENNGVAGLGIAAAALVFFFYAEFAEPAYQDVFSLFEGVFYDLEKGLDNLGRFGLRKDVLGEQTLDNMGFRQSHKTSFPYSAVESMERFGFGLFSLIELS